MSANNNRNATADLSADQAVKRGGHTSASSDEESIFVRVRIAKKRGLVKFARARRAAAEKLLAA
jgi:hypothetical protein